MMSAPFHGERSALLHRLLLAVLLLGGLLVRLPDLGAPLLEGAAAKQTHTAMVARNFYRDRGSWARPMVDDIGRPGYFLKEAPLVPILVTLLYHLRGGVDERFGRLLGIACWLAAVPSLAAILGRSCSNVEVLIGVSWFLAAPLAVVYSRAFMSDSALMMSSLAALLALIRWHEAPTTARAATTGLLCGLALALKPHVIFWLIPAGVILYRSASGRDDGRAKREPRTLMVWLVLGAIPAGLWYLHAAALHRTYPAAGALVAEGWIAPRLLLKPRLYTELGRQIVEMVFTPLGVAIAVLGFASDRSHRSLSERALLAWGAGTIVQCLVFATRVFDERARGTEYYLLPLVPVAALLIARGCATLAARFGALLPRLRYFLMIAILSALAASALAISRHAGATPREYDSLVERCERIQSLTSPREEMFVLSDRGGTILYYCDRRGTALTVGSAVGPDLAAETPRASTEEIARALQSARYFYIPFPELLEPNSALAQHLESEWRRVPGATDLWLFERTTGTTRRPLDRSH